MNDVPTREAWTRRAALVITVATLVATGGLGCATSSYKVPAAEVRRLVWVPYASRGFAVRVVPAGRHTPSGPATLAAALKDPVAVTPLIAGAAPTEETDEDETAIPDPARAAAISAGVSIYVPGRATRYHYHHHRYNHVDAAVDGAQSVLMLASVAAALGQMEKNAEALAEFAGRYDGWVRVRPQHSIRLFYRRGAARSVALDELSVEDTVGLSHGVLNTSGGPILPVNDPWEFGGGPPSFDTGVGEDEPEPPRGGNAYPGRQVVYAPPPPAGTTP